LLRDLSDQQRREENYMLKSKKGKNTGSYLQVEVKYIHSQTEYYEQIIENWDKHIKE
jgi:hypothetical protein